MLPSDQRESAEGFPWSLVSMPRGASASRLPWGLQGETTKSQTRRKIQENHPRVGLIFDPLSTYLQKKWRKRPCSKSWLRAIPQVVRSKAKERPSRAMNPEPWHSSLPFIAVQGLGPQRAKMGTGHFSANEPNPTIRRSQAKAKQTHKPPTHQPNHPAQAKNPSRTAWCLQKSPSFLGQGTYEPSIDRSWRPRVAIQLPAQVAGNPPRRGKSLSQHCLPIA